MKLLKTNNRRGNHNEASYEKRCSCCGKKFRAAYKSNDYYAYQEAKDIVNSHYNAHRLFCSETVSGYGHSA